MPIADSAFTDTVVFEACGLTQFVRVRLSHADVPRCRRCRLLPPLGFLLRILAAAEVGRT